jgi:iron(III) transport system substrate-binding protein
MRAPLLRLAAVSALAAACAGDGRTPLVVYSPHGRDLLALFEADFERRQPGIDLRYLDMGSQEVYDRVRSERANPQADVWFGGPDDLRPRRRRRTARPLPALVGRRRAGGEPGAGRPLLRHLPHHPGAGLELRSVAADDAPADWEDLLAERFRGRVLVRDPMASGVMRTFFGYRLALSLAESGSTDAGFAWLRRLDAQTKQYAANPALLFEMLVRGEGDVTVWELTDILLHQSAGEPVGWALPPSGTPVIDDAVALVAGAPHRAAAIELLEYVGSAAAQALAAEQAFRIPARSDLPVESLPEWAREVLARLVVAEYDEALAAARGPEWMAKWDREVRGRGGATP